MKLHELCRLTPALAGLLILAAATAQSADAEFDTEGWTWTRPIVTTGEASGFVRLPLTPEVLDVSQQHLADLRILNSAGDLAPFIVIRPQQELDKLAWRSLRIIDRVYLPNEYTRVTLDFGETVLKNRIRVDLPDTNYRRRALLEGSEDGTSWAVVKEDFWFFDVPDPKENYKIDTVTFPSNRFQYLRLTVYNMEDDPRRIQVSSADAAFYEPAEKMSLTEVSVVESSHWIDEEEKTSEYEYDLAYRNVPIVQFEFDIAEDFFYRGYELLGRNSETTTIPRRTETGWDQTERETAWTPVARGVLYRIVAEDGVSERASIMEIHAPYRYFLLRIHNQDSPPLDITQTTVLRAELPSLVFEAEPSATYTLIGGNTNARPPSFDLSQAVKIIEPDTLPEVSAGAQELLPDAITDAPWTERNRILLWLGLVLAVLAMGYLVLLNLKKMKVAPPDA
ncbi:MAG: DUF3999 family protein [Candidatus Hydrogenedentes bacterium]|nr:DUF3999 family protein [Candidatus Hydrogenedentota bacterium]